MNSRHARRRIETCTREITQLFLSRPGDTFLSDEVRAMVAAQMVRFIATTMEL